MTNVMVTADNSMIHGIGVFAVEDAPEGAVVGDGGLDTTTWVMGKLNHQQAATANVTIKEGPVGTKFFVTRRAVDAGEELTLDYGELLGYGTIDVWYLAEFVRWSLARDGALVDFEGWLAAAANRGR